MSATRTVVRRIGATIAGLVVLSGFTSPAEAAVLGGGQPAAAVSSVSVVLNLTSVSPTAVTPQTDLVVSGTARNSGNQAMKDVELRLRLRTPVLAGRQQIDSWLSTGQLNGRTSSLALTAPGAAKLKSLPPGATAPFTITVPAGQLGLFAGSGFGPRGFSIQAREKDTVLDEYRSTLVWAPGEQLSRTRLSLLVPITETTPSAQTGQPTEIIAHDLVIGGRLQKVLAATSDPAISWAVDPAILSAAQRMGTKGVSRQTDDANAPDDPTGKDTPSPSAAAGSPTATGPNAPIPDAIAKPAAQNWLAAFKTERAGREVFGLPFADPDLAALLSTKQSLSLLRHSDSLGQAAATSAVGAGLDSSLAWPVDGKINSAALAALGRTGRTAVVLASASQPPSPAISYTASGHSTLHGGGKVLTGVLYDEQLSQLVTTIASSPPSPANVQTLLAQLAAITLERPDDTRQVLATLPRDWAPNRAGLQSLMTAVRAAPWVSLRNISSLEKAAGPPRHAPIYRESAIAAQLPTGQITSALAMSRNLDTFGPALIDPQPVIEPLREQVASLLSVNWRANQADMSDQRSDVASEVNNLVGGVRLQVGTRTKLFTARTAEIPLYVTNDTAYAVKVVVRLQPQSAQLIIEHPLSVLAPAHSHTLARVPAKARASGNAVVQGALLTTTGQVLSTAPDFTVRVRPNWESRGMIGAAIVLGLMLLAGLVRSIRRRRRGPRVPLESVPDVDELATRRAAQAGDPAAADNADSIDNAASSVTPAP